jgi:cell division protein FtsW
MSQMKEFIQNIRGDKYIWLVLALLSMMSLLAVYSSTGTLAFKYKQGDTEHYLMKHGLILLLGIGLMYVAHLIHYKYYSRIALLLLIISIPLLAYTLFFGTNLNDASRWITLPVININFQASDLAKLALIMHLARELAIRQNKDVAFKEVFFSIILPVLGVCALIFPANLSTAAMLFCNSMLLMFIGRTKILHLFALLCIVGGIGAVVLLTILYVPEVNKVFPRAKTWSSRLKSFKNENEVPYQVQQAKIAIATGGLLGKGPGNSDQRNFLPHPYSDFIFAIIIEEYGLAGAMLVIILYLLLLFRCITIVIKSPRAFGALLAVGLGISLVLQAFVHMAVNVNILPVTGLTLPLISMGGTSVLFTGIAMGIILSVSRHIEESITQQGNEMESLKVKTI